MYTTLEFDKVLNILKEHALSDNAKEKITMLEPFLSENEVSRHLNETTEAKLIMEHYGTPPLSVMEGLDKSLTLIDKGSILMPDQLGNISQFLTACRRMKTYLKKAEGSFTSVACYGNSIYDLSNIEEEINRAIRGSQVDDKASSQLFSIRRKIENVGMQIKSKLDSLLRNNKLWFSEGFVSIRNGHYTLPVKREYKNHVKGTVVDVSQSGGTYFIEPSAAGKLHEEAAILRIEEENEVRRILYTLTALVDENLQYININIEAMEILDFIFAKAKLSISMKAIPLRICIERKIEIKAGRHPLLNADTVVPLDFHIGGATKGVIITGPNTGGKTVALKTIGLLSLMAQCGLHVPAESGCFTMNNYVLCDIGDGQSISENLSTFSSHLTNIIKILKAADNQSLVLLDELGSGTDPAEGMGLAIAILEELSGKNCLFVATTHYPQIKEFAKSTPGLINARMAFDRQSLLPLYQLVIGEAGESCALYIAKRLGLPDRMIERASVAAYGKKINITSDAISNEIVYDEQPLKKVIMPEVEKAPQTPRSLCLNIGDSVIVYPQKIIGIVYQSANEKGEVGVQIREKKLLVNHKRLKLHVPASELYPENYDFSIIFESVEDRKKKHTMARKHDPNTVIYNSTDQ
ncbi:MAG: DNA mismatch repair protein MutS [Clostridiaceae bacterium]|nr:DNA mismatch repair protein MutS [Clostridiaceae bacterium]